jgi:hypothetical protein
LDALQSMIFIKFEVIKSIECYFGLSICFICDEKSLITKSIFHTCDSWNESIFFTNIFWVEKFVFEEIDEFFLIFRFESRYSRD